MGPLPKMSVRQVAQTTWDAIVVGGGPAGALAARRAALAGLRTLLIEAKHFPREKVCGGYLNSRALEALQIAGVTLGPAECPATEVGRIEIICGHQRVR